VKLSLATFRPLPLGVELAAERVAVVVPRWAEGRVAVAESAVEAIPDTPEDALDEALGEALRRALSRLRSRTRRCVLGAPWTEAFSRQFKLPPGMRRGEAARAAELEADVVAPWPSSERIVSLDPIPGRNRELLLSIGRAATLERLVAIARSARLEPIAVDTPACAWRRVLPEADALLDAGGSRAALVVFSSPVPSFQLFAPRLIDERLAAQARLGLIEARRDSDVDVRRLTVSAPPERYDALAPLLAGEGYAVEPLCIDDVEGPPWSLAFALATWAVRERSAA
jgi:hypothetical protein